MGTLKRLVGLAHQRQMRVILDLPLGMPGLEHPYLRDAGKRDWFGPLTRYGVRQWNAEKPEVASYLIEISRFWKEQTGCDGFRLDSAHLHSRQFWQEYARALRRPPHEEDFFLLAELPLPPRQIGQFLGATGFSSAYDFSIGTVRDVFGNGASVGRLSFVLHEGKQFYPSPSQMCAQIDNYEAPDFITAAEEPRPQRMRLAMTLLLTLNRIPLLYSGDEAALSYQDVGALFDSSRGNPGALDYTRTLISLRKREATLRRGDLLEVQSHDPIFAFLRGYGKERLLVILNNSAQRHVAAFEMGGDPWKSFELWDLVTQRPAKQRASDVPLEIEAWDARIFRVLQ
jgi:alpha-amylase